MESFFDSFMDLNEAMNKVHPLAAIWLEKPVWLENKKKARIEAGDRLRIENNSIADVSLPDNPATHEVKGCYGNISDTVLYFELRNLKTDELLTLKIK